MKNILAPAFAALAITALAVPAFAEEPSSTNRAQHRMGDEGKLPATGGVSGRVPEMGAGTGQSSGTSGSSHRMGDEGKLPATNSMSKKVPTQGGTSSPGK
ncbi:hypothetical protein [Hyphomicrobium sp.]|uniref:hypothetical protein n=1 Tax=Hyphomicrobium sp. TaxID=82 RepID=UPI002D79A037|nr:hypothetical protein [Hyphomicrobium sp.]HET6387951.1 hypothetical protein [Hyphomicrobium sp.]